jgi:hypothetical protein
MVRRILRHAVLDAGDTLAVVMRVDEAWQYGRSRRQHPAPG